MFRYFKCIYYKCLKCLNASGINGSANERTMMMIMMMTAKTMTMVTKTTTVCFKHKYLPEINPVGRPKCTYFTTRTIDNNKIKHKLSNRTQTRE